MTSFISLSGYTSHIRTYPSSRGKYHRNRLDHRPIVSTTTACSAVTRIINFVDVKMCSMKMHTYMLPPKRTWRTGSLIFLNPLLSRIKPVHCPQSSGSRIYNSHAVKKCSFKLANNWCVVTYIFKILTFGES